MKKLFAVLTFVLFATATFAQTPLYPSRYTVATLPTANTLTNKIVLVTDSTSTGDCAIGGGSARTLCQSTGSAWIPAGDGTGAGGTLTDVNATSPLHSSHGSTPTITIDDAKADSSTKGTADFNASDFDDNGSGKISIDYANGQVSDATHKGFLPAADFVTFNAKVPPTRTVNGHPLSADIIIVPSDIPAPGSDTQVIFNDGGAFAGDAGLVYDKTTHTLTTTGALKINATAGAGFLELRSQSSNPVGATFRVRLFSNISSQFGIRFGATTSDQTVIFKDDGLTANRAYTFADADGVFVLDTAAQSLTNKKFGSLTTNGPVYVSGGDGTPNSETQLSKVRGGTGVDLSATGGIHQVLRQSSAAGSITVSQLNCADLSDSGVFCTRTEKTLTAGAGLVGGGDLSIDRTFNVGAGLGITVNVDDVALTTPGTLTVSSTNSSSGNHTHAITTSSNPGATAAILASTSGGQLTLVNFLATSNLYVLDVSTGFSSPSTAVVQLQSNNRLQSLGYVSQTTGWAADGANGAGDFRYLFTDELRAKLFTADTESVLAGSQRVTKSYSTISQTFTAPAAGGTTTLWVNDSPTFGDAAVFVSGDSVVIHSMSRTVFGPFTITDCVGVVTAYADGSGANAGQQSWTFTRNTGGNAGTMTASTTVAVNNLAQDLGTTGNGYVETDAFDGAAGVNAPYTQVVTWATAPVAANLSIRTRLGNIKGITGTTEYGLVAGNYSASNGAFFRASDQNFDLHGITAKWWDSTTNVVIISPNSGSPYLSLGSPAPTAYGANAGVFIEWNHTASKARASFYADANNYLQYDGVNLTWKGANSSLNAAGNLIVTGGTIGAWTLSSTRISSTNVFIDQAGQYISGGATPPTSYGNNVGFFIEGANSGRMSFYKDANNYLQWDNSKLLIKAANFTLDSSGNLTATSTTLSGAITATSGSITGTVTVTGALTAGGGVVTLDSNGIAILAINAFSDLRSYQFRDGSTVTANFATYVDATDNISQVKVNEYGSRNSAFNLISDAAASQLSTITLKALRHGAASAAIVLEGNTGVTTIKGTSGTTIIGFSNGVIQVTGDGIFSGVLKTGSGTTILTDSVGKILSAALNTVAVGQGGTGGTTFTADRLLRGNTTSAFQVGATRDDGTNVAIGGAIVNNTSAYTTLTIDNATNGGVVQLNSNGNMVLQFYAQSTTEGRLYTASGAKMVLYSGAAATVTLSSAQLVRFHAYGVGTITSDASGNLTSVSDLTSKRDIRPFTRGLTALMGLKPISYGYTKESGLDQTKNDYVGYGAQNVQEFIPEAVGHNADGKLTLWDRPILDTAINSILELNERIKKLEVKIADLEKRKN